MNVASLQIFLVLGGGLMCAAIDIHYRVNAVKKMERRLIAGTVAILLFGGGGYGWCREIKGRCYREIKARLNRTFADKLTLSNKRSPTPLPQPLKPLLCQMNSKQNF